MGLDKGFFTIHRENLPEELFKDAYALTLLIWLYREAAFKDRDIGMQRIKKGEKYASLRYIQKALGHGRPRIVKSIRFLEKLGLITRSGAVIGLTPSGNPRLPPRPQVVIEDYQGWSSRVTKGGNRGLPNINKGKEWEGENYFQKGGGFEDDYQARLKNIGKAAGRTVTVGGIPHKRN